MLPGAQAQHELSVRPYASGLSALTGISSTPSEPRRLYAVEQVGRIKYLVNGKVGGTFLDIRDRIVSGGEQGLLSLAFHPTYARNHRFYVNYTDRSGNTRVVEFRSRNGRAVKSTARQLLLRAPAVCQPQRRRAAVRLRRDALRRDGRRRLRRRSGQPRAEHEPAPRQAAAHQPAPARGEWQIVGLGLRNPWRFSFDRANGDLYIGDVGQGEWEEIDYRPRAQIGMLANYGWHVFEGRARYSNSALGPGELVAPIDVYSHDEGGCSVTGGYVYRGRAVSGAAGRYFFGDYCSGIVWSLRVQDGRATDVRREPFRVMSLTSFGEDAAGELYFATGNGRILKLSQ